MYLGVVKMESKSQWVCFREKRVIVAAVDEFCKAAGINRSDFCRLSWRRALVTKPGRSETDQNEGKASVNDEKESSQGA